MTTYCIYDGLSLLDIMVERHSKNSVSFNLKVDEDMILMEVLKISRLAS